MQDGARLCLGCGICQQKIAGDLVRCIGRQGVGGVGLQGGCGKGQRLGGVEHEIDVTITRPEGRAGRHRFEVARLVHQASRDGVLAITPFETRGSDIQLDAESGVGPVLKDFSILVNFVLQSLARDVKVDGIELTRLRGEKPLAGVVLETHLRSLRQIRLRGVEFISNRRRIGHLHAALGVLETGPQAPDPVGLARVTQGIGGDEGKALVQIGWRQGIARHLDWGCIRGHGGRGAHERDTVSHLVPHRQGQGQGGRAVVAVAIATGPPGVVGDEGAVEINSAFNAQHRQRNHHVLRHGQANHRWAGAGLQTHTQVVDAVFQGLGDLVFPGVGIRSGTVCHGDERGIAEVLLAVVDAQAFSRAQCRRQSAAQFGRVGRRAGDALGTR